MAIDEVLEEFKSILKKSHLLNNHAYSIDIYVEAQNIIALEKIKKDFADELVRAEILKNNISMLENVPQHIFDMFNQTIEKVITGYSKIIDNINAAIICADNKIKITDTGCN